MLLILKEIRHGSNTVRELRIVLSRIKSTSYINSDESRIARNEVWIEDIKKDFYLEETLHILRDLINLEESYSAIEEKFKSSEKKEIKP